MPSNFNLRAEACSQLLEVRHLSGEQFLGRHQDLVSAVEKAVLPFRFKVFSAAQGVQVEGDAVAVLIASRIFQQALNAPSDMKANPSWLATTVSDVIAHALKHDLGQFLKGMSRVLMPKSLSQVAYLKTLLVSEEPLVIGLGPTGTGKTHLAIAAALSQLAEGTIKHIVITRPHVVMEGETVTAATQQELEPDSQLDYFDDILHDLAGHNQISELKKERKLDVIPLGRMRGRTFNEAFIILDEAQNTTIAKMRMAVTRIGKGSRMVVTGDPTHVELLSDERSGLEDLLSLLEGTDIGRIHQFEKEQIIRNSIVARLEELYARRHTGNRRIADGDAMRYRPGQFGGPHVQPQADSVEEFRGQDESISSLRSLARLGQPG